MRLILQSNFILITYAYLSTALAAVDIIEFNLSEKAIHIILIESMASGMPVDSLALTPIQRDTIVSAVDVLQ